MVTLPRFLQVEPVGQCNLRCQMCPIQFRQRRPAARPAGVHGVRRLHAPARPVPRPGGAAAPGARRADDAPALLRHGGATPSRRGIKVSTNTNLTLLNARRAELCVTSGLGELHVSIDGATAETYERIRVRAHFDRVIANLEGLVEARARLASATPRIRMVGRGDAAEPARAPRPGAAGPSPGDRRRLRAASLPRLRRVEPAGALPRRCGTSWTSETLLGEDPERVERYFDEARGVAARAGRRPAAAPDPAAPPPARHARARSAATGPGAGRTSAIRVWRCRAAWSPRPIGSTSATWPSDGAEAVWNGPDYQAFRDALSSDDAAGGLPLVRGLLGDVSGGLRLSRTE